MTSELMRPLGAEKATHDWKRLCFNSEHSDSINKKSGDHFIGLWDGTSLQSNRVKFSLNISTDLKLRLFSKLNQSEGKINSKRFPK